MGATYDKAVSFSDERKGIFDRLEKFGSKLFELPGAGYWDCIISPDIHILDAGCGSGYFLRSLAKVFKQKKINARLTGIDEAPDFISWARELAVENGLASEINFIEGNYLDGRVFGPVSFDVIHISQALFQNQLNLKELLNHIFTLTKPGGVVIIQELNLNDFQVSPVDQEWQLMIDRMQESFCRRWGNPQDAGQLMPILGSVGFLIAEERRIFVKTKLDPNCGFFDTLETFAERKDRARYKSFMNSVANKRVYAQKSRSYIKARKSS